MHHCKRNPRRDRTGQRAAMVAVVALVVGAAGFCVVRRKRMREEAQKPPRRTGSSLAGMEFSVVGDGPKTMLVIPGGPGSEAGDSPMGRMIEGTFKPYVDAGYTVWTVTRPRNMPTGHTAADMADEHAQFIREEIDGPVDAVLGQSFGGMIAIYLAANHPDVARRFVLAGAAATLSDWGSDIDLRFAALQSQGKSNEAAATLLEYFNSDERLGGLRRAAGPIAASFLAKSNTPAGDLVVETEAEAAYDARDVLSRLSVPVLLVCGDADRFFPHHAVQATARAIPGSTVVTYPGIGHMRLFGDKRLPRDVLAWLGNGDSTDAPDGLRPAAMPRRSRDDAFDEDAVRER